MLNCLISYAYLGKSATMIRVVESTQNSIRWMLDSGAFTAHMQGKSIELDEYCAFLDKYGHLFWQTVALDKVGDFDQTKRNLALMRARGLNPMPVLTVDAAIAEVPELLGDACHHICCAGGVTEPNGVYIPRLAAVRKVTNGKVWMHGLGFSRGPIVAGAPLDAVDSSSWNAGKRYGQLLWYEETRGGFGHVSWSEALSKPWDKLPWAAKKSLMELGLTRADLKDKRISRGGLQAIGIKGVHAFVKFDMHLRSQGKVYFWAIANEHDLALALIGNIASTRETCFWSDALPWIERAKLNEVRNPDPDNAVEIPELAAVAAAQIMKNIANAGIVDPIVR